MEGDRVNFNPIWNFTRIHWICLSYLSVSIDISRMFKFNIFYFLVFILNRAKISIIINIKQYKSHILILSPSLSPMSILLKGTSAVL